MPLHRRINLPPLFFALVLQLGLCSANAHHGMESVTEIRLLEQQTSLIANLPPIVVSTLLGAEGPHSWSEQVVADRQAQLQDLARGLFVLRIENHAVLPTRVSVSFEVSGQIAFVLTYPALSTGLSSVEAAYLRNLGPEFTGTIRVYGPPESPTERRGSQIAALELTTNHRVLSVPALSSTQP